MKRLCSNVDEEYFSKKVLVEISPEPSGTALVSPTSMSRSAPNDLIELAMDIQKADSFIKANACNKLQVIAQQVRFLQRQAENVLLEAKTMTQLHHVACNFVKVPGTVYHLYEKPSRQKYFGMLSPQEWNNCPHKYLGSFRLEHDQSWTPIDKIEERDNENQLINKILSTNDQANLVYALQNVPMDI